MVLDCSYLLRHVEDTVVLADVHVWSQVSKFGVVLVDDAGLG